ncbi:glycosyltransferase family 2 protein, partial [Streptomyces sp. NPDC056647]|uniref:glycosyltransferase family 2 protein n=1 Tax=Streptomyces sp. NPDC056647 TaxID=3345890 RepID=UPI0036B0ABBF
MRLGAVIITMGDRPGELRALIDSVRRQNGDPVEIVVVGNGAPRGGGAAGGRSVVGAE